MMLKLPDPTC